MISCEAKRKKEEAIRFFEEKYKKGIKYQGSTPEKKREASKKQAETQRNTAYPNSVIEKIVFNDISCEKMYTQASKEDIVILFFHSGGLSGGSVESGRIFTSYFVEKHNCISILPDFRLAPEASFEEMLSDCYLAYAAVRKKYINSKIILSGISSGALLALSVMQLLYQKKETQLLPDGIIVGSAVTFLDNGKDSNIALAHHDIVLRSYNDERLLGYAMNEETKKGCLMNPLYGEYSDFPPIYIGCGSDERLLDDSVMLFKQIKRNITNKDSYLSIVPGMWHGFWEDNVPETYNELERIWEFIDSIKND